MPSLKPWYIYRLEHPDTGQVMYVGATTDPKRRFLEHVAGYHQGRSLRSWVLSLKKEGKIPHMEIIEKTNSRDWQTRERHWIAFYRKKIGIKLLNKQAGGIVRRKRNELLA